MTFRYRFKTFALFVKQFLADVNFWRTLILPRDFIHDEIIAKAPMSETPTAVQILHDSMIDAGKMYMRDILVLVDVAPANNGGRSNAIWFANR